MSVNRPCPSGVITSRAPQVGGIRLGVAPGAERHQAVEVEVRAALGALEDVVDLEAGASGHSGRARKTTRLIGATFTCPGAR